MTSRGELRSTAGLGADEIHGDFVPIPMGGPIDASNSFRRPDTVRYDWATGDLTVHAFDDTRRGGVIRRIAVRNGPPVRCREHLERLRKLLHRRLQRKQRVRGAMARIRFSGWPATTRSGAKGEPIRSTVEPARTRSSIPTTLRQLKIDLISNLVTFPGKTWPSESVVSIENAITGSGNDTLIGGSAANVLDGGLGADRIDGARRNGYRLLRFSHSGSKTSTSASSAQRSSEPPYRTR